MEPLSPLSPTQVAQSLINSEFFGVDVRKDILPQVQRALDPFGYKVALMNVRVSNHPSGKKHPNFRPIKETKQTLTTIRIYCARCTTHCYTTLAERAGIFRCAVIGILVVQNLPPHYCQSNDLPEGTKSATLTKLFPHPKECLTKSKEHMLKYYMSSCTVGSGFVKLPIDLRQVIGPTFDTMLDRFKQLSKGRIQVNQDNECGKKIGTSFANFDIRLFVQCDDPNSTDAVQQKINRHYGLDDDQFQRELELTMRRLTLFLANHLNIADECNFSTPHSSDNIMSPEGEGNQHPALGRDVSQHLWPNKASVLIAGYSRTGQKPINQAPHTDFGRSVDGYEIHNNPRLTKCCKPFTFIVPLVDPRKIVIYQERNGSISQQELVTNPGEIMIVDAGCTHGGYTYEEPTPKWEKLPTVYPALHVYFASSRHMTDTSNLTISSYHVMNYNELSPFIPGVTQENRSEEAKNHAEAMLRMLPHLDNIDQRIVQRCQSCLEELIHE